jgi:hypothetical protein
VFTATLVCLTVCVCVYCYIGVVDGVCVCVFTATLVCLTVCVCVCVFIAVRGGVGVWGCGY